MKNRILKILITICVLTMLLTACSGAATTASSWGAATITESRVYYADNGQVFALKYENGNNAWQPYPEKAVATRIILAAPVEVGDQLLVGDYSGLLVSLNTRDGSENWEFSEATSKYIDSPLVVGETILAPNADGTLYALDLEGKKLWSFDAGHAFWAQPVSDGEVVYAPSLDHYLYAIDIATGNLKWKTDLVASLVGRATLLDGTIYLGNLEGGVFAVDAEKGSILWEQKVSGGVWSAPIYAEDKLYIGDQGGSISILNAGDGTVDQTIDIESPVLGSGAVLAEGILFGNENGELILIGFDGSRKWTRSVEGAVYSNLVTDGSMILVVTNQGEKSLIAMDDQGNEIWYKE